MIIADNESFVLPDLSDLELEKEDSSLASESEETRLCI